MKKKYPVTLTEAEREQCKSLIAAGSTAPARKLTHARILLKADQNPEGPGWVDEAVAEAVEVSQPTVARGCASSTSRRACRPLSTDVHRTGSTSRKLDGEQEAHLLALACGRPPEGQARWRVCASWPTSWWMELEVVGEVSYQTVRRILKKTTSSPT